MGVVKGTEGKRNELLRSEVALLQAFSDEAVDHTHSIAHGTSFNKVAKLALASVAASWILKLERPQEAVALSVVLADGEELVNKIINGVYAILSELVTDELVGCDGDTLLVNTAVPTLDNKATDHTDGRITDCNIGFNGLKHVKGSLINANEDGVVNLTKAKKLKDLLRLRWNLINTTETHDKSETRLRRNVVSATLLGIAVEVNGTLSQPLVCTLIASSTHSGESTHLESLRLEFLTAFTSLLLLLDEFSTAFNNVLWCGLEGSGAESETIED